MAIRKYTNTRAVDLSPGLQDVLRKNGMQAHISFSPKDGYQLIVLGHDSPVISYKLNDQQIENLMGWGSTYANKKAYNTFTSIVKNDFYMPQNFVSASNAFGRVAMGLHGYRIGHGEYDYDARPYRTPWFAPFSRHGRGWGGDFVGWAPRGFGWQHLRRVGDHAYRPWGGGPIVAERPDGRIKPGEMKSGGYGFYYKGRQQQTSVDALDQLTIEPKIKPLEAAPRPQGQGLPYKQEIIADTDVYFNNQKWQNILASHGIVINADKNTLTIQSNLSKVDLRYDLTPEELKKLTNEKVSEVSVAERLAIINSVIGKDFSTQLTRDMLETKELVSLDLKPEVRAEVEAPFIEQERRMAEQQRLDAERAKAQVESDRIANDPNAINGREIQTIMGNKGWFQPVDNGRAMYVGEIRVDKVLQEPIPVTLTDANHQEHTIMVSKPLTEEEIQALSEMSATKGVGIFRLREASKQAAQNLWAGAPATFLMSAQINGRTIEHTISEKDYNKFLDLDDKHRLKMFDNVFKEVEIKSAHGQSLYADDMYMGQDGQTVMRQQDADIAHATSNSVDGAALQEYNQKKGFYRERAGGREVEVRDIKVDPVEGGKYKMTAVINGQAISHEISQKQYDKFLAVDDYHRMQLFAKIFDEVDIKTRPGEGHNLGAALLAALVVTGEVVSDIAMGHGPRGPRPEIYESHMGPTVYHKPGVVSPADVAAANFRSEVANLGPEPTVDESMGRGR